VKQFWVGRLHALKSTFVMVALVDAVNNPKEFVPENNALPAVQIVQIAPPTRVYVTSIDSGGECAPNRIVLIITHVKSFHLLLLEVCFDQHLQDLDTPFSANHLRIAGQSILFTFTTVCTHAMPGL
jgi:hypothetical protein